LAQLSNPHRHDQRELEGRGQQISGRGRHYGTWIGWVPFDLRRDAGREAKTARCREREEAQQGRSHERPESAGPASTLWVERAGGRGWGGGHRVGSRGAGGIATRRGSGRSLPGSGRAVPSMLPMPPSALPMKARGEGGQWALISVGVGMAEPRRLSGRPSPRGSPARGPWGARSRRAR
jgi:hypothetical protein